MTKDIKVMNLPNNVKLHYQFDNITDALQNDLKDWIEGKINSFMDSYFKKFLKKEDAEIQISVKMKKNQKDKYNGNFNFILDGKEVLYQREDFVKVKDLIDNAFDHLKSQINKMHN